MYFFKLSCTVMLPAGGSIYRIKSLSLSCKEPCYSLTANSTDQYLTNHETASDL